MEEVRRTGEEGRRRSGRRAEGLQGGAGEVQLGVLSEACCPKLGTFPPPPLRGRAREGGRSLELALSHTRDPHPQPLPPRGRGTGRACGALASTLSLPFPSQI